jgi:hypothetical protein
MRQTLYVDNVGVGEVQAGNAGDLGALVGIGDGNRRNRSLRRNRNTGARTVSLSFVFQAIAFIMRPVGRDLFGIARSHA